VRLEQSQSVYFAEISGFARLRPTAVTPPARSHSIGRAAQAALEHFRSKVDAFENVFSALFHTERLTSIADDSGFTFDALLRYLRRAITGIDVSGGVEPRIGRKHIGILAIDGLTDDRG
jgi:hypothetical protein